MSNEPEQLKWFLATFCREERSLAYVRFNAKSQAEAEVKADELSSDDILDWEPVHGDEWVEAVKPDDGKQSHCFSRVVKQDGEGAANE